MVGQCWRLECSWGCTDVRTFLTSSLVFLPQRHWHAQMPDDIVSMQQAQNPSNNSKCWKLIENDSFHNQEVLLAKRKADLALCPKLRKSRVQFSFGQLLLFCQNFQPIQRYLPKGNNCQERILRNDAVKFCFWNAYSFTASAICFVVASFIFG